jgi:hypothetical protein
MRIDVEQIARNRRVMNDSVIDSPYVAHIEDSDADYGEYLYDNLPDDRVGFMPPTEKQTNGRKRRE